MTRSRSLNGQTLTWRKAFLGGLGASGLARSVASALLLNREAMRHWVELAQGCLELYEGGVSDAKRTQQRFAEAAKIVTRMRVAESTLLEDLDVTVRTYNMCKSESWHTVGAVLNSMYPPSQSWTGEGANTSRHELRNRLIAGGFELQLPSWLRDVE